MDVDVSAPEQLVDLDRYPVLAPGSPGATTPSARSPMT
jgi:hypothetical protein